MYQHLFLSCDKCSIVAILSKLSMAMPPPNMLSQAQNNEPSLATQPLLLYTTFTEPGTSVQSTHIVLSPEQC